MDRRLAQLGERRIFNPKDVSSSLTPPMAGKQNAPPDQALGAQTGRRGNQREGT